MFFGTGPFPKDFMEMFEKMFVEKINDTIRNPDFISHFGKMMTDGLDGKKKIDEMTKSYLEKMHFPSREDIAKVLQYLQQIESRIISLEEKIEDLQDRLPASPVKKTEAESKTHAAASPAKKPAVGKGKGKKS